MMEEEHRHEERVHRRKQRALEREKRREDRRRKLWEEYEKCLERRAEGSVDLECEAPNFDHHRTMHHRRRAKSFEPETSEMSL